MDHKPGYKTSEFWLTLLACLVALFLGSGAVGEDSLVAKIAGFVAVTLNTLGYTYGRSLLKKVP